MNLEGLMPNSNRSKPRLVADFLHNPIEISTVEKYAISTKIFNRLHNILQNSTLYFTYPSDRTSRFSHSLGVMHKTGLMFRNGFLNSQNETRENFIEFLKKEVWEVINSPGWFKENLKEASRELGFFFQHEIVQKKNIQKLLEDDNFGNGILSDSLYNKNSIGLLDDKDRLYYFIVFYQSIRLASLFHDLGHPPFSHVSEFALSEIEGILQKKQDKQKLSYIESNFLKVHVSKDNELEQIIKKSRDIEKEINDFIQDDKISDEIKEKIKIKLISFSDLGGKYNEKDFHEIVSFQLSQQLLTSIQEKYRKSKFLFTFEIIKTITMKIIGGETKFYKNLQNIYDSDCDSDRLDYVSRDICISGVSNEQNFNRLLATYQLVSDKKEIRFIDILKRVVHEKNREKESYKKIIELLGEEKKEFTSYEFIPSIQALNNLESFLYQRFNLYKYVIFHHRVVKTDALMKRIIIDLTNKYFHEHRDTTKENNSNFDLFVLTDDISGLWQIKDITEAIPVVKDNLYVQWDDAFLLSLMRKEYYKLTKKNTEGNKLDENESILEKRLDEIISNSKHYYSLFKRTSHYKEFDDEIVNCSLKDKNFDWDKLKKQSTKLEEFIKEMKNFTIIVEKKIENRSKFGFFLSRIFNLLKLYGLEVEALSADGFIEKSILELKDNYSLEDIFFERRNFKPGISQSMKISDGKNIRKLEEVSLIKEELEMGVKSFPTIYVYFRINGISQEEINEIIPKLRVDLGSIIWKNFSSWISSIIEQEGR